MQPAVSGRGRQRSRDFLSVLHLMQCLQRNTKQNNSTNDTVHDGLCRDVQILYRWDTNLIVHPAISGQELNSFQFKQRLYVTVRPLVQSRTSLALSVPTEGEAGVYRRFLQSVRTYSVRVGVKGADILPLALTL